MKKQGSRYAAAKLDDIEMSVDLDNLVIAIDDEYIYLDRIKGTKGGYRYFFLCPMCDTRCRVVYFKDKKIGCGVCCNAYNSTLNRSKTDSQYYWELALREARKVDPNYYPQKGRYIFDSFPRRPKRMRAKTYYKHYCRFLRYWGKGNSLWLK